MNSSERMEGSGRTACGLPLRPLCVVLLLAAASAAAATDPPASDRALDLAKASAAARFVADPADPARDLVTGRTRPELEAEAAEYFRSVEASDSSQFARLEGRGIGGRDADELLAAGRRELAAGRRASAELAWTRLAEEWPDSPQAGTAMLHLAALRQEDGDMVGATRWLASLPEMHAEAAVQAAPLMARLLEDVERALGCSGAMPSGRDAVRLQPSVAALDLETLRSLSEWASGFELVDLIARTLRVETSGDLLRRIKNLGQDGMKLDGIVALVPRKERVAAIRCEEQLRDPTETDVERRVEDRTRGKLDRLEDLARIQQLQVILLARSLSAVEIDPAAKRLGEATLAARADLAGRIERTRSTLDSPQDEDSAVGQLFALSDVDGNGRLTPLYDDEGLLRPKRPAVEGDMRNAVDKPLDDDNARAVDELFERCGLSEKALFLCLVRATTQRDRTAAKVDPARVRRLLARLHERGVPAFRAAHPGRSESGFAVERDYLARLEVLRQPGEGLDVVLERDVLADAPADGDVATDAHAAKLVAELASLGTRRDGAWILEDDPRDLGAGGVARAVPVSFKGDHARSRTAREKLARAEQIRGELDDLAASRATSAVATGLVSDLESQGMKFSADDVSTIHETLEHEDLGSLAMTFDEWGKFSGLQNVVAFTNPGGALSSVAGGRVAWGFGLDVLSGAPASSAGFRGSTELPGGAALRYHVGAVGGLAGATDTSGVTASFRPRSVWQPEIGLDASVLRGFMGRGFFNLIRDVNVKHERQVAALFSDEDAARKRGREAFVSSLSGEDARALPAVLFTESLGWSADDLVDDAVAYQVLSDAYEMEKARQVSQFHRGARKVRFAGIGLDLALLGGDLFLLAGPKLAIKDYKLYSHFVEGADRSLQSEEASLRRTVIPLPPAVADRSRTRTVDLAPAVDSEARPELVATRAESVLGDPLPGQPAPAAVPPAIRIAALDPVVPGLAPDRFGGSEPDPAPVPDRPDPARVLERVERALAARNVPISLSATADATTFLVAPRATTRWASQSIELYASAQPGLGLELGLDGRPMLVAPPGGAGLVVDWMEEIRSVTGAAEADEVHRITFSLAPGLPPSDVIEGSSHFLRAEVVDGELVGCARIATRFTDRLGQPVGRAPIVTPDDADAQERLSGLRSEASTSDAAKAPEPPARWLRPVAKDDGSGAITDPAALDSRFLDGLRHATKEDVLAVKRDGIAHARLVSLGETDLRMDPETVDFIQERSLAEHGRLLAGPALERAQFVLVHEGLYRADGGDVPSQIARLDERAVTPFAPDREIGRAPDPRTHRLMELAGVDEPAALREIQSGVRAMIGTARRTNRLERSRVPAGTRIVTASWSRSTTEPDSGASGPALRGVQWTTAMEPVEAHLLPDLPLSSNAGKYVAALALGPDLPALDDALRRELESEGDADRHEFELDRDLVPAVAKALAEPVDDRTIVASCAGLDLTLTLAQAPRAGALARCKNATIFAPPYGATLEDTHPVVVATTPVAMVGTAESHSRFVGRPWVGWRRLSLLAGAPILDEIFGGHGSNGSDVEPEPNPEPEPPAGPRDGAQPPTGGRAGRPGPPDRPIDEGGPEEPGGVRDGSDSPTPGRNTRRGPPDRPADEGDETTPDDHGSRDGTTPPPRNGRGRPGPPKPPRAEPKPPRDRDEPPPGDRDDRPRPPEPPDRPRRPVD